jgi:hypothetical protein
MLAEKVEVIPLSQKRSVIGGERVDQGRQREASGILDNVPIIIVERAKTAGGQKALQARGSHLLFAMFQIQSERPVGELADFIELVRRHRPPR